MPLDSQRERRVKSGVEDKDAESVKKRWLTIESFTALCNRGTGLLFNPQWQAGISWSDTSSVSDSTLDDRKASTILSREVSRP